MARLAVCAWVALVLVALSPPLHARAPGAAPDLSGARALLLFSYHPGFPSSAPIRDTVTRVLGERGVVVEVEYMDAKRHGGAQWRSLFARALGYKLAHRAGYGVVLVADDDALGFALEHRHTLLGAVPLVFLGVNDLERAAVLDPDPGVTGVVEQVSVAETVALARRLDPALEEVLAVADETVSGRADQAAAHAAAGALGGVRLRVLSMGARTWDELAREVASLRKGQAVLRMSAYQDRRGETRSMVQGMELLARHAPVPVYTLRRGGVGRGAVGGVVVDFAVQAETAARLALRVLEGTPAGEMPVVRRSPNVPMVDAAAMARFGLDPARIPPQTAVVNPVRAPDLDGVSLSLGLLVVVLSIVVCCLVVKYVRRLKQDAVLRDRESRFRTLVEDSQQGVLIHRYQVPLFVNQAYARILGYDSPEEIIALGNTERLYAEHERARMRAYGEARRAGRPAPSQYQYEAQRKDGSIVVLSTVVHMTTWNGRPAIQHNVADVTEREMAARLLRESEERYRSLVENATEALVVYDVDEDRFVDANGNALALFGADRDELMRMNPVALSPPAQPDGSDSATLAAELVDRALAGEQVHAEWTHRRVDGREVPTELRLVRLPSSTRRLVRGSVTDVSERLEARRALVEKSAQLEATLENTDQGISMTDANLTVVAFNRRFLELLEFPADRFSPGDPLEKFFRYNAERGEYGAGDADEQVRERLELARTFEAHRFVRTRPNGMVLEVRGQPLPGGGFVSTYSDITETHRLSEQLARQARHDALTDLLNRREFEERLEQALQASRSAGREHAVCYLDLDQFKVINDTCGHMAGDELLRQLAATLQAPVRKSDVLARLGGDEFGVLLADCALPEAQRVATALRAAVEDFRFSWDDKSFRLGVSIGLVPVTRDSGTAADVMAAADAACYAAKDQGRNRVHLFTEGDETLAGRQGEMRWVVRLQQALDEDRLCLMSQTIAPLGEGRGDGEHFEILVRMRDPDGTLVGPGLFLPAAERYNMMGRLDRWVVRKAFRVLARGPGTMPRPYTCSINLSGQSLGDDEFLAFIIEEFRTTGVPADRIVFEVTETAAITNLTRATRFMTALRDIGCRFALDDFGSGLSSFGYLKTLPVDFLKIDGMFVKDILDDPIDHAMVRSINEIGHVMGKCTIAEFVENDAVRERLRELGVDYAQGYGVGRPVLFPATQEMLLAS